MTEGNINGDNCLVNYYYHYVMVENYSRYGAVKRTSLLPAYMEKAIPVIVFMIPI